MGTELFANDAVTTVTNGGTTAPAGGTTETWTVASSASFPAASSGTGTQFHVADPAQPTEKILVTNVSGPTWSVTRGAESSVPLAHTAGFTVRQVITAGFLGTLPASIAGGDASISVGATPGAYTVETGPLNQVANLHPPVAAWSNNGQQITSLASGVNPQDAAATAQVAYFLRMFAV